GLREVRHVLAGAEQRLDEGVVVTDSRTAERGRNTELAEHGLHGLALERAPVIAVQHERLIDAALLPDRLLDQVTGVHSALAFMHFPAHDLAAEQVQDQVQEEEAAADFAWQPSDVPTPNGVGCIGAMSGRRPARSRLFGTSTMVLLVGIVQDSIVSRLRG